MQMAHYKLTIIIIIIKCCPWIQMPDYMLRWSTKSQALS